MKGAILPIVAVCIVILFIAAALAVDIARIHVTRAELRTATDAAARAAVDTLSRTQSQAAAIAAAKQMANENSVAGDGLLLADDKIIFGRSVAQADGTFVFTEGDAPFNSVRVVGERVEGSPSGPVGLVFGPIFGVSNFQPVQSCTATRLDRDIALVLDVSGSMNSFGRFPALQNAVTVFLQEIAQTQEEEFVSLSTYSTSAQNLVQITSDMAAIDAEFRRQRPGGRTAVGQGLQVGLNSVVNDPLARDLAEKTVIIMTDGNHNQGINPLTVANGINNGVVVHTITFSRGANQNLMRQVAEATGGTHLHANSNQELIDAFREIALQLQVITTE